MSLIGQNLGQYRIIETVGKGGMAAVYKAYQPSLDRFVAVKVMPAQHALTPGFKDRFIREARVVAKLNHPNILPVYDFGVEGDLSYFVMKYVPDRTLGDLLGQPMSLPRVRYLFDQVAEALEHAHEQGVLHRDIKPSNILLDQKKSQDWVQLTDFGLAKIMESSVVLTASGATMGTPAYMSPEQADGRPVDHRTDIYSLGIVLYEMLTGCVPYEGETPIGVLIKHIIEPLPLPRSLNPNLPESVEQVILKSLAKEPSDRYDRVSDMAVSLGQAIETSSISPVVEDVALSPSSTTQMGPGAGTLPTALNNEVYDHSGETVLPRAKVRSSRTVTDAISNWWWVGGILLLGFVGIIFYIAIMLGDEQTTDKASYDAFPTLAPCVPNLISPEQNAVVDNGRYDRADDEIWDFDWSDCPEATKYHLYVKLPQAKNPVIDVADLVTSSYNHTENAYVADFNRHGWTWKVRAQINGQWGDWSELWTFDVEPLDTDPPSRQVSSPDSTDQSPTGRLLVYGSEDFSEASVATYYPKAQSFVFQEAVQIHSVALHMQQAYGDTWKVRLLSSLPESGGESGLLNHADLHSKTLGSAKVSDSPAGWVDFNFTDPILLEPGQIYYLFIDSYDLGDLGPDSVWSRSASGSHPGPFSGGTGWVFVYAWDDNSNFKPEFLKHFDYAFRIYYSTP
jgi:serine/threonine protein kinase